MRPEAALADLRYGFRMLRRTPLLSLVVVVTIGVGVGVAASMFSLMYGAFVRGLPIPDGDRLVLVLNRLSDRDFEALRREQTTLVALGAYWYLAGTDRGGVNVGGDEGPPERLAGAFVTSKALDIVGVPPLLGRTFRDGEDVAGAPRTIVLGHGVWRNRFGADPDVLGQSVRINGEVATVIGVMPPGFRFPFNEDLWISYRPEPAAAVRNTGALLAFGKLEPGVSAAAASQELTAIMRNLQGQSPDPREARTVSVRSFHTAYMPPQATDLVRIGWAGVLGVLLVVCANVSSLLMARGAVRSAEIAIRRALGAGRLRVIRQLLVEACVLGVVGCATGLVIARLLISTLDEMVRGGGPYWVSFRLDGPTTLFALALAFVTAVLAGTVPAARASRSELLSPAAAAHRGAGVRGFGRFSAGLIVTQLALACSLVVGAGLLARAVNDLQRIDFGFRAEGITTARLQLPERDYPTAADRDRLFRDLLSSLRDESSIQYAALGSSVPGLGTNSWRISLPDSADEREAAGLWTRGSAVTPGFFEVFDIPSLRGRRLLDPDWQLQAEPVAVVSESFAVAHLGGADTAVGQSIRIGTTESGRPWMRIVGVVPDVYEGVGFLGTGGAGSEHVYVPLHLDEPETASLVIRGAEYSSISVEAREVVATVDPDLPLYAIAPLIESLDEATLVHFMVARWFTILGGVALFLAVAGLHGTLAFSVTQRRRELGIRIAVGADRTRILGLVLRRAMVQLGVGSLLGVGFALAVGQLLASTLYGVDAVDGVVMIVTVCTLVLSGIVGALDPAFRATRVDPLDALRTE